MLVKKLMLVRKVRVFTFADPSDTSDTPKNLTPLKIYDTASVNGSFFIEYSLAIEFIIK